MTGPTKHPRPWVALRKPGQRKKDHGARKREAEWRAYKALWQKPIDEIRDPEGEDFYQLRRNVLGLNRKQCARLLRVSVSSVLFWETGRHPVPFYAYAMLLFVSESQAYRLASYQWRDWRFVERFNSDAVLPRKQQRSTAYLVNRRTGACFSSEDLDYIYLQVQRLAQLEGEALELRQRVDGLTTENTSLRELYRVDGVTGQLHDMRAQLDALLSRINTAEVIGLRAAGGKHAA